MKVIFISRAWSVGLLPLIWLVAVVVGCASKPAPSPASATASPDPVPSTNAFGVLVMAHGGEPEWNQAVLDTVEGLKKKYTVEVAFGMADATTIQEAVQKTRSAQRSQGGRRASLHQR